VSDCEDKSEDAYKEMKEWIDNATYAQLLSKWRFAPAGDPFFQGQLGEYYQKIMAMRRHEVGATEHIKTSKRIGWVIYENAPARKEETRGEDNDTSDG
jgi:hypothetical protein